MSTDKKISELPAAAAVAVDDLLVVVSDPASAPVTSKITVADFVASAGGAPGPPGLSSSIWNVLINPAALVSGDDPGTGKVGYDNAAQVSATTLFVSWTALAGNGVMLYLLALDISATLFLVDVADTANYQIWRVNGVPLNGTNAQEIPVEFIDAGGTGATNFPGALEVQLSIAFNGAIGPAGGVYNANSTDDIATATDTYLDGSVLALAGRLQVGTILRWKVWATKTAAGTAAPVWSVRFGTAGDVTDTAQCTFTGNAQTAASDSGYWMIDAIVRATGITGVVQAVYAAQFVTGGFDGGGAAAPIQAVLSGAFDLTAAALKAGLSVDPGVAGVWTFPFVTAELVNMP